MDLKDRTRWAITYIAQKRKISNFKIAKLIGLKADTVNSYRSKLVNPKVDFIIKFCDTFGFDIIWFTKGEGEPFPGANDQYPEVCRPSRFEVRRSPHYPPDTQDETPNPCQGAGAENTPGFYTESAKNDTEQNFIRLCNVIGIRTEWGWKISLAKHLEISPATLSNAISRDSISNNLLHKITEKGHPPEKWYHKSNTKASSAPTAKKNKTTPAETSFRKLAILSGVKIEGDWIFKLAKVLNVTPWSINVAIRKGQIEEEMIQSAEMNGYDRSDWMTAHTLRTPSQKGEPEYDVETLLKMAEDVLISDTLHATSLTMNIISLKFAVSAEKKKK